MTTPKTPIVIENWAFALIPIASRGKRIVALVGEVDGKFHDSYPIVSMSRTARTAVDEKGQEYSLGVIDLGFENFHGEPALDAMKRYVTQLNPHA